MHACFRTLLLLALAVSLCVVAERTAFSQNPKFLTEESSKNSIVVLPGHLIIPQIANAGTRQGGYFTAFQVLNLSRSTATYQIQFFNSNGQPMRMPLSTYFYDVSGDPSFGFNGTLGPGGYHAMVTIPDGSPTAIGYAKVTMEPENSIGVNATFMQIVFDRPLFGAGVPLSNIFHNKTSFMTYVSGFGFTPTLALVSLLPQNVTLIARTGSNGIEICRATINFFAGQHRAGLLRDVLPCIQNSEGVIEILAGHKNVGLAAIGFQAHDSGAFVTQPLWTNPERLGIK